VTLPVRAFAVSALLAVACGKRPAPLEYVPFRSAFGDFECLVPKGWGAETTSQKAAYRSTIWTGPEDPKALWGAPRFVLTWHAAGKPFEKVSGDTGRYESIDDYVRQMTATVWGPDPQYPEPRRPVTIGGRRGERMTVRFEKDAYMSLPGEKPAAQGGKRMWRRDTAAFIPTQGGFYTIVFPSSEYVEPTYRPAFAKLLESLQFLKDNPLD
jgi:hypothetical protein